MLDGSFEGTEKHYGAYIEVLKAVGLCKGERLVDYGCSWGYGSWQLAKAGFDVVSYDVDANRTQFAVNQLGCRLLDSDFEPASFRCLFSAHVLEHLPDPALLWDVADSVLAPRGIVVCFFPNGDPEIEKRLGSRSYHRLWGKVHPLLIGSRAAKFMAESRGYKALIFTSPYNLQHIREAASPTEATLGEEMLLIARKANV